MYLQMVKKLLASDTSTITPAIKEESCKYFFIVVNCVHIHCMNIRSMLFSLITFKIRYTQLIGRISHFGILHIAACTTRKIPSPVAQLYITDFVINEIIMQKKN